MPPTSSIDPHLVTAHTTAAASSIAQWVELHYGLAVAQCHLIRRGLNDNYRVDLADGSRWVARLYALRPRGPANVAFETALLVHLAAQGCSVAAPRCRPDGRHHAALRFPEGPRALALFAHAEGAVPDTLDDFAATARELAHVHQAALTYAGPPSRYGIDGVHLAGRTLAFMECHPLMDGPLLQTLAARVHSLQNALATAQQGLTRVVCHGDTHGFNNHVHRSEGGALRATFFDFDDAGPGFLAYDLAVLPWSYLFRKGLEAPDDVLRERWAAYLQAYRAAGGAVSEDDLRAIPLFLQLRHLWNIGEAFGRLHHWGTHVFSMDWLRKQVGVMDAWGATDWCA